MFIKQSKRKYVKEMYLSSDKQTWEAIKPRDWAPPMEVDSSGNPYSSIHLTATQCLCVLFFLSVLQD